MISHPELSSTHIHSPFHPPLHPKALILHFIFSHSLPYSSLATLPVCTITGQTNHLLLLLPYWFPLYARDNDPVILGPYLSCRINIPCSSGRSPPLLCVDLLHSLQTLTPLQLCPQGSCFLLQNGKRGITCKVPQCFVSLSTNWAPPHLFLLHSLPQRKMSLLPLSPVTMHHSGVLPISYHFCILAFQASPHPRALALSV